MKRRYFSTFVFALATSAIAFAAQAAEVKNIVIVRGAFADGSGWRQASEILERRGFKVTVVQQPITSLADDVAATKRVLDLQDGPTLLAGHSYGGMVITEAGNDPNVAGLVYVAPFQPDKDESLLSPASSKPASGTGVRETRTASISISILPPSRTTLPQTCRRMRSHSWRNRRSSPPRKPSRGRSPIRPGRPRKAGRSWLPRTIRSTRTSKDKWRLALEVRCPRSRRATPSLHHNQRRLRTSSSRRLGSQEIDAKAHLGWAFPVKAGALKRPV
jgi:pimeloyl-ACP methyl ester carboxylesterase